MKQVMFRVLIDNLTLGWKVRMKGEEISDEDALKLGISDWYASTSGEKKGVKIVEYVEDKLSTLESSEMVASSGNSLSDKVCKKGYTLNEVLKMSWSQKAKALGIKLAKEVNDYGKSNNG